MANNLKRLKTQIDFSPTCGYEDASIIFTVLAYYTRGGKTDLNASQLIVEAFRHYDPDEPECITKTLDLALRADSFVKEFGIMRKSDIRLAIKTASSDIDTDLLEPSKKFLRFDPDDPAAAKMWDVLKGIRYSDRGMFVNRFLLQYFAHGHCEYYKKFCAAMTLRWMQSEYRVMRNLDLTRLNAIIDLIWLTQVSLPKSDDIEVRSSSEIGSYSSDEKELKLRHLLGLL